MTPLLGSVAVIGPTASVGAFASAAFAGYTGAVQHQGVQGVDGVGGAGPAGGVGPGGGAVGGAGATRQPRRCLTRWCRRHRQIRLAAVVGPLGQGRTWSRSQKRASTWQPGKRQRPSRCRTSAASAAGGR